LSLKIEGTAPGFNNSYHFHASPKYRASAFSPEIASRTKDLIESKSTELGWVVHDIAVDDDHIHFLIQADSTPSNIAHRLFGFTSFSLRKEFPELKELNKDHFWGGEQCKCISDENHFNNTVAYISRHKHASIV
jgi:REP element-mobilizing transposase RayT